MGASRVSLLAIALVAALLTGWAVLVGVNEPVAPDQRSTSDSASDPPAAGFVFHGHWHSSAPEAAIHVHSDPSVPLHPAARRWAEHNDDPSQAYQAFIAERDTYREETVAGRTLEIVTVVPKDSIPAIYNPRYLSADEATRLQFDDDELVLGVSINGDHRAYGVALMSTSEIVNDIVGGRPIAVTW